MLERLATFLYANGRRVLAVAVVAAAIAGALGVSVANRLSPYGDTDPATQSVQATTRFEHAAGRQIDAGVVALVRPGRVRSAGARTRVGEVAAQLRAQPDVTRVVTYYGTHDRAMVSRDGRSTYVLAYFKPLSDKRLSDDAKLIESRFSSQHDVKLGGEAIANAQVNTQVGHDLAHAELLAFPVIFLLSFIFFRSVVASLLPPLLGGLTIVGTFFLLRLVSTFTDLNVYALNLTIGLGLGLAIDYSLFIVSRYREEATRDGFGRDALRRTLQTAGRSVVFSSVTVAFSVAALTIFPQSFLYSMGIAGAIVALLAATLALTVLPALLAVLGPRVNALSPRRLQHAAQRDARPAGSGAWYRLAQFVTGRPAQVAVASAAVLIALGIPFFTQIRFISADARVLPQSASAHQVQDALDEQFPPNRTTPLEVVVGAPASSPEVRALTARIERLPDVSAIAPAQPAGHETSLLEVAPVEGPLTGSTEQLVHDVRAIHTPYYLGVAGQTASYLDLEHASVPTFPWRWRS
jgi:RND superfamily putative drug exporter